MALFKSFVPLISDGSLGYLHLKHINLSKTNVTKFLLGEQEYPILQNKQHNKIINQSNHMHDNGQLKENEDFEGAKII